MSRKCPQCFMIIKDLSLQQCPRCKAVLTKTAGCENCSGCSVFRACDQKLQEKKENVSSATLGK